MATRRIELRRANRSPLHAKKFRRQQKLAKENLRLLSAQELDRSLIRSEREPGNPATLEELRKLLLLAAKYNTQPS